MAAFTTVAAPSIAAVSSSVRVASSAIRSTPGSSGPLPLRVITRTRSPFSANRRAVAAPVAPAPMTIRSVMADLRSFLLRQLASRFAADPRIQSCAETGE
jgi:hypothetical protein